MSELAFDYSFFRALESCGRQCNNDNDNDNDTFDDENDTDDNDNDTFDNIR